MGLNEELDESSNYMRGLLMEITQQNFEQEVLKSNIPVLIDFWAPWCGPCKIMGPIVEEIGRDLAGKVKVGKVNVDENNQLAQQYNIMSIPTFAVFQNGKMVAQAIGAMPKEALLAQLALVK